MSLDQLSWLMGIWRGPAFGGLMEEMYGTAEGGAMLGTSRVVVDGVIVHKEFISIASTASSLVYEVALPSKTHAFPLRELTESSVIWEDADNPWPRTIMYERTQQGLTITLLGESKFGEPRKEVIQMTKA